MVWGCLLVSAVSDDFKIDRWMIAEKYPQILIHHKLPSGKSLISNAFIWHHDPKLSANALKAYLDRNCSGELSVMFWPSHRLDIIEAVQDHLYRKLNRQERSLENNS